MQAFVGELHKWSNICFVTSHRFAVLQPNLIPLCVGMLLRSAYRRQQLNWSTAEATLAKLILLMFRFMLPNSSLLLAINIGIFALFSLQLVFLFHVPVCINNTLRAD